MKNKFILKKGSIITLKKKSEMNFGRNYILLTDVEVIKNEKNKAKNVFVIQNNIFYGSILLLESYENFFEFWKILSK